MREVAQFLAWFWDAAGCIMPQTSGREATLAHVGAFDDDQRVGAGDASSRGVALRVDRTQSLIRGVKILGLKSRNGRTTCPRRWPRPPGSMKGPR